MLEWRPIERKSMRQRGRKREMVKVFRGSAKVFGQMVFIKAVLIFAIVMNNSVGSKFLFLLRWWWRQRRQRWLINGLVCNSKRRKKWYYGCRRKRRVKSSSYLLGLSWGCVLLRSRVSGTCCFEGLSEGDGIMAAMCGSSCSGRERLRFCDRGMSCRFLEATCREASSG